MRHPLITLLMLTALVGWSTNLYGQEKKATKPERIAIEIINQDGENVAPKLVSPKPGNQQQGQATFRVDAKDGKVVIVDDQGKKRELDTSGAQSIIITQSAQSSNINGQQETKRSGKAIIVGPDGQRKEIIIGDGDGRMGWVSPNMELLVPQGSGVFRFEQGENKFMIGVNCQPVGAAMASQLRLDEGVGLLVTTVSEGQPAAEAGIQVHDILLYAGQKDLGSVQQLVELIQEAGKEKTSLEFTVVRQGKEESVKVSPVERPEQAVQMELDLLANPQFRPRLKEGLEGGLFLQLDELGPGIVIPNQPKDMRAEMDEMRQMMKKLRQDMKKEMEQLRDDADKNDN